jgi:hypothetical protein
MVELWWADYIRMKESKELQARLVEDRWAPPGVGVHVHVMIQLMCQLSWNGHQRNS